uniref:Calponin-homology (CH) domain-containing protein n=1 Tax=Rhabditophanes sp. KR3021 TaxID=114890 RepID=A0AC35TRH6_9BILA
MSGRAEKSGLAYEAHQKIQSKFDPELATQILSWIKDCSGEDFDVDGSIDNFVSVLKNGVVLCRLANSLVEGSIKKVNASAMAFKQMENISFFLTFAEKYVSKTELFQTIDLYEGQDPNSVLVLLGSLARKSQKLFNKNGLGPKEAETNKREWTEEQLNAGQGIIGLQAGQNRCATASGISMGNTRHM